MKLNTEHVWEQFSNDLRIFILSRVGNPQDAEDILQETFVKIHNKLETLENSDRLAAWVYQITRHAIADHYRRRREVDPLPEETVRDLAEPADESLDDIEQTIATWMKPMVMVLPERYRDALILTEFEGMTQKQMAEQLQLSHSGAKSRVQRGRAMMRDLLIECCEFEFDRQGGIIDYRQRIELHDS